MPIITHHLTLFPHVELSPLEYKDAHMVMKLDLTDFDSHLSCVQEVLDKYNQVRGVKHTTANTLCTYMYTIVILMEVLCTCDIIILNYPWQCYPEFCVFAQIDCLVNNAGRTQIAPAMKTSLEVDKSILNLNTVGTISLTKAVLPHMIRQKKGLIVTISSAAGKYGACLFYLNDHTSICTVHT